MDEGFPFTTEEETASDNNELKPFTEGVINEVVRTSGPLRIMCQGLLSQSLEDIICLGGRYRVGRVKFH